MRKRTENKLTTLIIWASYSLADWAASFTIELITSSRNSSKIIQRNDLLAFWAPLLLRLGGPDTITAFAMEDNEFWLWHSLTLIFQVVTSFYLFLETLPSNKLWLPTSLIFLAGVIKYFERTRSLYGASWGTFRETMLTEPDPGPEYAKLMEAFSSKKVAGLPTTMSQTVDLVIKESKSAFDISSKPGNEGSLDEFEVMKYGYHFFKIFKGLIVDLISHNDRNESRAFFLGRSSEEALKVFLAELNFIYEVLYTKFVVIHDRIGYLLRFVSLLSVLASLGIFFFVDYKQGLDKFDIQVTYTLLLGALSLETIALFNLIFSDWTTVSLDKKPETNSSVLWTMFEKYLKFWSSRWSDESGNEFSARVTPVLLRRWSEYVAGFNLITYCLKKLPKKSHEENDRLCLGIYKKTTHLLHNVRKYCLKYVVEPLGAQDFLDELKYVLKKPLRKDLWEFIFEELLRKSKEADQPENIKKISSARGAYVLEENCKKQLEGEVVLLETLKTEYIENVTFDESLLLWHIATELCYHGSQHKADDYQHNKFISKLVSDYMLYLLAMKPAMMSAVVGIGQIRYRDTCAEAKRFFRNKGLGPNNIEKDACENLLAVSMMLNLLL